MEFNEFVLVAVYSPCTGDNLERLDYRINQWDFDLFNHCEELEKSLNKPVVLAGDINVCHQDIDICDPIQYERKTGNTSEERESLTKFLKKGWVDTFRRKYPDKVQYSWWSLKGYGRG